MSAPKHLVDRSRTWCIDANNKTRVTRHMTFDDLPQFLTVSELCTWLSLGRSTAYDLLRRGDIKHVRFRRVIRIPKNALKPYLGKREH